MLKATFLLCRIDSFCRKFLLVPTRDVEGWEELKAAVANHQQNLSPPKKHQNSLCHIDKLWTIGIKGQLHIDIWRVDELANLTYWSQPKDVTLLFAIWSVWRILQAGWKKLVASSIWFLDKLDASVELDGNKHGWNRPPLGCHYNNTPTIYFALAIRGPVTGILQGGLQDLGNYVLGEWVATTLFPDQLDAFCKVGWN